MTNEEMRTLRIRSDNIVTVKIGQAIEALHLVLQNELGCSDKPDPSGLLFNEEEREILACMTKGEAEGWPDWLWKRGFEEFVRLLAVQIDKTSADPRCVVAYPSAKKVRVVMSFANVTGYVDRATGAPRARVTKVELPGTGDIPFGEWKDRWPEMEAALIAEANKP